MSAAGIHRPGAMYHGPADAVTAPRASNILPQRVRVGAGGHVMENFGSGGAEVGWRRNARNPGVAERGE
jgi:hypothetical protein